MWMKQTNFLTCERIFVHEAASKLIKIYVLDKTRYKRSMSVHHVGDMWGYGKLAARRTFAGRRYGSEMGRTIWYGGLRCHH